MRALQGLLALFQILEREPAVVVADDVHRLLIGRNQNAVAFTAVGRDASHRTVGIQPISGEAVQKHRLVTQVARIGEVDAALLIDRDVVQGVLTPQTLIVQIDHIWVAAMKAGRDKSGRIVGG